MRGAKSPNKNEVKEGLTHTKVKRKSLQKEAPALRKIETRTKHLKAIPEGKGGKAKEILRKINAEE